MVLFDAHRNPQSFLVFSGGTKRWVGNEWVNQQIMLRGVFK